MTDSNRKRVTADRWNLTDWCINGAALLAASIVFYGMFVLAGVMGV